MSDQDAALSKMSKYLLSGSEMLQDSCPDCLIPLLKSKDGTIFCASCGRKVIYASEAEADNIEQNFTSQELSGQIYHQLEAILLGKLDFLTNQAAANAELKELDELLGLIERVLSILDQVKKQKQ